MKIKGPSQEFLNLDDIIAQQYRERMRLAKLNCSDGLHTMISTTSPMYKKCQFCEYAERIKIAASDTPT